MTWLIIIYLCVLALIIAFLFVPITVRSSSDGEKRATELHYLGMRFKIKEGWRPKKRKKKRRKPKWRLEGLLEVWDEFTLADFRALPRFLRDLMTHLNLRIRRFHILLATPDPALTGILNGWTQAVVPFLPEKWPLRIGTSFDEETPQVFYEVEARVRPGQPLWDVIHLILRLPLLRLARSWRQVRK